MSLTGTNKTNKTGPSYKQNGHLSSDVHNKTIILNATCLLFCNGLTCTDFLRECFQQKLYPVSLVLTPNGLLQNDGSISVSGTFTKAACVSF